MFRSNRGSSLLESALVMAVLLPVFVLLNQAVNRYQIYSAMSDIVRQEVSGFSEVTADDLQLDTLLDSISTEFDKRGFKLSDYLIQADVISLGVNPYSGRVDGSYQILNSGQKGSYGNNSKMLVTEVIKDVSNYLADENGVLVYTASVNTFGMLDSNAVFRDSANALLLRVSAKPVSGLSSTLDFVQTEVSYLQVIPLRIKMEV